MVEYIDPLTGKKVSYHIAKTLRRQWAKLKDGKLEKLDEDRIYIVDGRERTGKSLFTLQQAKFIDPTFNVDRVCFTPEEFLEQIRTTPKGGVVVFDEAFRGLSSKSSQSKVNKMIVQSMMECGQRNLIIFIVLPTFFLLEIYAAILRSNALFHVYKDKNGKRVFKTYNYAKKSLLYREGKKKGYSYAFPKVSAKATGGRFFNIYPISEKQYRKKKADSLQEMEPGATSRDQTITLQRNMNIYKTYLLETKINPKLSRNKFSKQYSEIGMTGNNLKQSTIVQILREFEENHPEITEKLKNQVNE